QRHETALRAPLEPQRPRPRPRPCQRQARRNPPPSRLPAPAWRRVYDFTDAPPPPGLHATALSPLGSARGPPHATLPRRAFRAFFGAFSGALVEPRFEFLESVL